MWQFLCDSLYDLKHLKDRFGQEPLSGWWGTRKFEMRRFKYLSKRLLTG